MKGIHEMNIKKSDERRYAQDEGSVKSYTFSLPGETAQMYLSRNDADHQGALSER